MRSFQNDGFEIHPAIFSLKEIAELRKEASRLQEESGTACVRGISKRSDLISRLSFSEKLTELLPEELSPVRSILFDKTPEENWPVLWHQDLTIAVQEKVEINGYGPWSIKNGIPHVQQPVELLRNMVTLRIHLDDTPKENGALIVMPKSHLLGKGPAENIREQTSESAITCECTAGDVLLMSPLLFHSSKRSEKPDRRRIIHIEYARRSDLDSRLDWQQT